MLGNLIKTQHATRYMTTCGPQTMLPQETTMHSSCTRQPAPLIDRERAPVGQCIRGHSLVISKRLKPELSRRRQ